MEVLIVSKKGLAIRVPAFAFPLQKRGGQGIIAMRLREGDEVVSAIPVPEKKETTQ